MHACIITGKASPVFASEKASAWRVWRDTLFVSQAKEG